MTQAILDYISGAVKAITPAVEARDVFHDRDARGGAAGPLEEMAGQTRVFEVVGAAGPRPVPMSRVDPVAWDADLVVRVRYDAAGQHDRQRMIVQIWSDAVQIVRALYTGGWSSVAGLSVLNAGVEGMTVEAFGLAAAGALDGEKVGGYLCEVPVFISYDVT